MQKQFFKWSLGLLLCLSSTLQAQDHSGLLFRSYETAINDRSSLHLSPESPVEINETLSVSFDVSFWRVTELGYLLRFSSEEGTRIDLLYRPGEGAGTFKLSIGDQPQIAEVSIPAELLVRNNWLSTSVIIDKKTGQLTLTINGKTASVSNDAIKKLSALNPVFGRSPYNLPSSVATPRFAIKNLSLKIDQKNYFWPLNKKDTPELTAEEGSYTIKAFNPEWIVDTHQNWQEQYVQKAKPIPGISFDQSTDDVYIVEEELITIYNIASRAIREFKPQNSFPKDQGTQQAIYSTKQKQLYGYDLGPLQAYSFDFDNANWQNTAPTEAPLIYIWQHAPFENTINGNPMILAGYGYFTARNQLLQFDPVLKAWQEVPIKGDTLNPRFMLGITEGFSKGEYYIYGGYGNTSGKQDLGFENLNDLYLLNLNDSTLKKVWELPPGSTPYLPSSSMALHPKDSAIYALGHAYLDGNRELELLKIGLNTPNIEVVPLEKKLPFEIRNIGDYNLFLHYAEQTKELVSILRINSDPNNAEVRIHTISYPPSVALPSLEATQKTFPWQLVIPGITLFIGFIFLLVRKRNEPSGSQPQPKAPLKAESIWQHHISVMGEFKVTNPAGQSLTQKLSPKLKELFLLILLHSLSDKKGVSTKLLTEILWPDASAASAKNNRGVNLQKLRQALNELNTVEINFHQQKWQVSFKQDVDCDLYHIIEAISKNELETVISISKAGTLLPTTSYDWLDSFKVDIHFKIIQYLISRAELASQQQDWATLIDISRTIFHIDPVHDEALRFILRALMALKKPSNAKSTYEQFAERYKNLYQEAYPIKFDDLMI